MLKKIITGILTLLCTALPVIAGTIELPKTGQTTSYYAGDDGDLEKGVAWPSPRFTDNGNGTVKDNLTGLVWTKNANLPDARLTWQQALDYVAGMNNGTHPNYGYTDWRLPNVNELKSLIDNSQFAPCLPSGHPFTNVQTFENGEYWSSTNFYQVVWTVGMGDGHIIGGFKGSDSLRVWPVRAGQCSAPGSSVICLPKTGQTTCYNTAGDVISCTNTGQDGEIQAGVACPSPRFTDNGNGTVKDNLTGLVWTKNANLPDAWLTWQQALDYVAGMNNGTHPNYGYTDWRLPNVLELESLADYSQYSPALPLNHPFTNLQGAYWSSTTWPVDTHNSHNAWVSLVNYGIIMCQNKTWDSSVWPVRSGQSGASGTVTLSKTGTGAGTVTSNPAGINCGSDCSETYAAHTAVTLHASADAGSVFTGWSGGGCSGTGDCTITVDGDVAVTADFSLLSGCGNGVLEGSEQCDGSANPCPGGEQCVGCACVDLSASSTVAAGYSHTVLAKPDGTARAKGWNAFGQCDLSSWSHIVQVSAGYAHTVGLKSDGTVVATGACDYGQCDVGSWKDIVQVSAGYYFTVGLKSDGTVVATGACDYGQCDVGSWKDIVQVSAGYLHTVGVKSDGTVVAAGWNGMGQCAVSSWSGIARVAAGYHHTVGLKADGTAVAAGSSSFGQGDVTAWSNLVQIAAGYYHTVGIKSDGTVVAAAGTATASAMSGHGQALCRYQPGMCTLSA